jgi:hypothetical protein
VRAVPRLCELYPGICLTTEQKARKNLNQGKKNFSQVKKKPNVYSTKEKIGSLTVDPEPLWNNRQCHGWHPSQRCIKNFHFLKSQPSTNRQLHRLQERVLTPLNRVLLEKWTVWQLVKKISASYGTPRFITAFTSDRHLSLSWASSIQSMRPHPIFWRSILILSSHLRLGLQELGLLHKIGI